MKLKLGHTAELPTADLAAELGHTAAAATADLAELGHTAATATRGYGDWVA